MKSRKNVIGISIMVLFTLTGCSNLADINKSESAIIESTTTEADDGMVSIYCGIYEEMTPVDSQSKLEILKNIITKLGEKNIPAVDSENQIDMVEAEQMIEFCKFVEEKKKADTTLLVIISADEFIKYSFQTENGKVNVLGEDYRYTDRRFQKIDTEEYEAYTWKYTEEGYLFFEMYHMSGYDGPSGHHAVRVMPLDEKYRELNRQYILPINYALNNMFILNWNENDFGDLNFYDLFDVLYSKVYNKYEPYVADDNCGVGAIYHIPKEEFEKVITSYFPIDSNTLQSKTKFFAEDSSYEYRPRGLYDCEPPSYPFPEVVGYVENADGTITLTVNAIYPDLNLASAFVHEVVVRPLSDTDFQYVSNRIISANVDYENEWHVNRLTEDEWQEFYGETE